ncbi:dnaJ homolog subfamily C member 10 isoform X3 [Harpegnathos saltator]|uniref:dnaJ homolog subfamily C member 10 isoform X3 n=1 Tax=Harpegnathos saltator TaxID=610380 RepID=UPI0009490D1A|nr:dnaJ homolog subfamily C member 10 isoform X3 [Harpegnathos saltator]
MISRSIRDIWQSARFIFSCDSAARKVLRNIRCRYKVILTFCVIIFSTHGEDYYEILGISKSAGQDEIRKAFKKLAIIYHPDKNGDDPNAHDKFIQLTTAYEVLKEPDSRRKYDIYGKDGLDMSNKKQTYHSWSYYQNSFDMYEDDQHVVTLEKHDYFESVINSDSIWFVNFYSPMCNHCHDLASVWKEIAKLLDGVVKVAAVNCEDNWQLCHQVGIRVYPTLLHFEKHGTHYTGRHTQEAIVRFALDRLNIHLPEISKSHWELFLRGMEITERPVLIFTCGDQENCFTSEEKLIVAAIFVNITDKVIDVKVFLCKDDNCHRKISYNTQAVYLAVYNASSWEPVLFDNIPDVNTLMEKLLDQLPRPQELTENDFENIRKTKFDVAWLLCFYLGDSTAIESQMKKLSAIAINFGKLNCGRNGQLCNKLGVNRYPIWGILKSGGAFELHHGKNTNNDIIKFVQISAKATNVWALTAGEALSILQRNSGNEVWFLDWYAPWCPPCVNFLSELRRASLEFDMSIVRFGTVDCTVHAMLCRQYNIHSYPTAMLINGSNTHQFTLHKTAANIIQFINERRNPSVIELTSENFHRKLTKKKSKVMWIVDYFAPWCGPCQRLAPEWITVAKMLSDLSFINVASVNCEVETSICASQGIRSYPNIRLYPIGSEGLSTIALYNGQRDSLSILTWTTTFFPKKVRDLNPSEYREVLSSKHMWVVDFYMPQCGHCQRMEPQFAIAAQLVEKVRFGRINCNFYMHDCVQANVQVFPTLVLYKSKRKQNNSYDGVRIIGTTAKTIRDEISEIVKFRMKHDEL